MVTLAECREQQWMVFIGCPSCRSGRLLPLPRGQATRFETVPIGDLWREGRFRCARHGVAADHVSISRYYGAMGRGEVERWDHREASDETKKAPGVSPGP